MLDGLVKDVFECGADTAEKMAVVEELNQLKALAAKKQGDLSATESGLLEKLKEGSLKLFSMVKVVKENEETVKWIAAIFASAMVF